MQPKLALNCSSYLSFQVLGLQVRTLMSYLASTFYLHIQGINEKTLESREPVGPSPSACQGLCLSLERRNNSLALHQGRVIAEIRVVTNFKRPWWKLGTPQQGSRYPRTGRVPPESHLWW